MNTVANLDRIFRCYYLGGTSTERGVFFANKTSVSNPDTGQYQKVANTAINGARGIIEYTKGNGSGTFAVGSNSVATTLMDAELEYPLMLGCGRVMNSSADQITSFSAFIVYGLVITEGGVTVRNYIPREIDGVVGLYDTVNGNFFSHETNTFAGVTASAALVGVS